MMKFDLSLCLRGTIDVVFILRWLREAHHAKGKSWICFVALEKAFDIVSMLSEWAMRKKGTQEKKLDQ